MRLCSAVLKGSAADGRTGGRASGRPGRDPSSRSASPLRLDEVVLLQIQLQDGVLDGGEDETNVLRVCQVESHASTLKSSNRTKDEESPL